MRLALFEPDIAGNVGAVLRLGACFGAPVDLIEPMGFAWNDAALRRAAMDYGGQADVIRHVDFDAFAAGLTGRLVLFTTRGAERLDIARFQPGDTLLFGSESRGAPDHVHARADLAVRIPIRAGLRSLNLAVSAGIALSEALRQTQGYPE
ncbi:MULTISPECIES: tRNA (cytidine(34)-2'-O)-methyltransferase [Sphingomonas]|jgi:tRNA (cytidine/uridine-2'-O-)-methyltransferase|uniref:tRNA (cytidine(34)-2'-O)-methyltransferase n=1 Tax=Sphingomonas leidyi TaxID=68569 RepID=A0A7X5V3H2_9SPHN|nr:MULTISPECIES: tRNA (cytidine(34)-2'-O)-methyltransferase [Sphingomonas]MBN8812576.1 tRNA (cytidine(34)-2'-O)-methyltransferase [Sphingomonas sp.]NIJ66850.1 tRNA (cytidine/uridine-2'-O-)-methyltransferase [Sphingomonas leidyi]OJY52110.1 MAG: rRNA methyltransferase [Sphingomonas sp. 67-41]